MNSIIDFYTQENRLADAISMVHRAEEGDVKVTSVSYQNTCELMIMLKETDPPPKELVQLFCSDVCSLDRGGYIVMLGVTPLEMMLLYGETQFAVKYLVKASASCTEMTIGSLADHRIANATINLFK